MPGGADSEEETDNEKDTGWTVKNCCRKTIAFLFSHIGLTALVVGYSIMGAFLFRHLEFQHEVDKMGTIREWKNDTVEALWNITTDVHMHELFQVPKAKDQHIMQAEAAKTALVENLWTLTMDLNVLWKENWTQTAEKEISNLIRQLRLWNEEAEMRWYKPASNWTTLAMDRIEEFQNNISDAAQQGFETKKSNPKWTFSSSFLYALSVITTIGYGHVTPKTQAGKVVTVLYAVVGIPIMLMFLSNIGNLLAKVFIGLFSYMCRCRFLNPPDPVLLRHRKLRASGFSRHRSAKGQLQPKPTISHQRFFPPDESSNVTPGDETAAPAIPAWEPEVAALVERLERKDNNVPVIGCLVIMSAYLFGGATLFALWEDWPYLDAFYFCFVTLTTIGFGDFVPGASMLSADTSNQKLVMCCIYVLVGLALIACCFNLMHNQVRSYLKAIAKVMGIIRDKTINIGSARGIRSKSGKGNSKKTVKNITTVSLADV
ncbi:TWiK family of potassium channels protein 7-like [Paramacrobiotus metropolitanus]|uniref:TWiK family of potassium channels protein 7-like n=1 Tax=Paramacrobiotus metropolitanus TaxID=2943436 RepID=UPI00244609E9|nr:TWiK family of potassium channels protein 7-like [Paramacrobiotus metropolitanus]